MAILFDLDGTLLDTGPDIHRSVNAVLALEKRAPVDYEQIRPVISYGGAKILEAALNLDVKHKPEDKQYLDKLLAIFFEIHLASDCKLTTTFPGIDELLNGLEELQLPWGIVTNKTQALTEPLLAVTGHHLRSACVVFGDTTPHLKPHPASLNYACELLNVKAEDCVYVGDAATDIQAGKAAGMQTIAAAFGYVPPTVQVSDWQADHIATTASEILPWIKQWSKRIK